MSVEILTKYQLFYLIQANQFGDQKGLFNNTFTNLYIEGL